MTNLTVKILTTMKMKRMGPSNPSSKMASKSISIKSNKLLPPSVGVMRQGTAHQVSVTVPRRHYFFSTVGAAGWLALAMESRMVVSAMVFCIW